MTQNENTAYYYRHTGDAFKTIWREEGFRGFYRGMGSSLLGIAHVAVQFPLYERFKHLLRKPGEDQPGKKGIMIASAMAKMAASVATYPHEVIRTRLQNETSRCNAKYKGIIQTARTIYAEEGWQAFYSGMATNLLRTVPASVVTLLTYELFMRWLQKRFPSPIRLQDQRLQG